MWTDQIKPPLFKKLVITFDHLPDLLQPGFQSQPIGIVKVNALSIDPFRIQIGFAKDIHPVAEDIGKFFFRMIFEPAGDEKKFQTADVIEVLPVFFKSFRRIGHNSVFCGSLTAGLPEEEPHGRNGVYHA